MSSVPVTLDFETEAIENRPVYPPMPVGVAVKLPGKRSAYYAWGHPSGNNCTLAQSRDRLQAIWRGRHPLLFHNAKFDLDVAHTHLGLPWPSWDRIIDTMVMIFLAHPDQKKVNLKESAELLLGLPPDEQTKLRDWIINNVEGVSRKTKSWGAHICKAPVKLVKPYACGDTDRTYGLYKHLKWVMDAMSEAFEREHRLMQPLVEAEARGIPIRTRALIKDVRQWEGTLEQLDHWIAKRLKWPGLEVDKRDDLADALEYNDLVDEWIVTPKALKRSTSLADLKEVLKDLEIYRVLSYRARLTNCLRTFGRPWLEMAREHDRIFVTWNQVRQADERKAGRAIGARTGRLSSNPNVQNIPKSPDTVVFNKAEFQRIFRNDTDDDGLLLPRSLSKIVCPLPQMRDYIAPEKGEILLNRDYNQQEWRILAHYEDGDLMEAYCKNPRLDQHAHAQYMINTLLGTTYGRKPIKNTGFGILYGMGLLLLADKLGLDQATARVLRNAYKEIAPGLRALDQRLRKRAKDGR